MVMMVMMMKRKVGRVGTAMDVYRPVSDGCGKARITEWMSGVYICHPFWTVDWRSKSWLSDAASIPVGLWSQAAWHGNAGAGTISRGMLGMCLPMSGSHKGRRGERALRGLISQTAGKEDAIERRSHDAPSAWLFVDRGLGCPKRGRASL